MLVDLIIHISIYNRCNFIEIILLYIPFIRKVLLIFTNSYFAILNLKNEKNLYTSHFGVYDMISTKTKTKNIILLAVVSATFILSVVSYAIPQPTQAFAQGLFQTEQSAEDNNNQTSPLTTATSADVEEAEEDQKIILGGITIPINSNTTLSLEMPDSKITVEPNE